MKKFKRNLQSGVALYLTAISLPMIIALLMLLFDLGRMYVALRQAQNLADISANAGATLLSKTHPNYVYTVVLDNYKNIRPTIKALTQQMNILGTTSPGTSTGFMDNVRGSPVYNGKPNFTYDTMTVDSTAGLARLTVKVRMGLRCNDSGVWRTIDLEPYANYWCLSNYADVTVTIGGLGAYFGRFFGITSQKDLSRNTLVHVRPMINDVCATPSCGLYSAYIGSNAASPQFTTPPPCGSVPSP